MRDKFLTAIRSVIGAPYIWGGQDEGGFDCSGLIMWAMAQAGNVISTDLSARDMSEVWSHGKIDPSEAKEGCLIFYGHHLEPEDISHVMVVLDVWQGGKWPMMTVVGARGGDSTCTNPEQAYGKDAFVDVERGDYWHSGFRMMVDPF